MRIAICTDQYLPLVSGLADSVDALARALRARGHGVRVYAPKLPGAVPNEHVFHMPALVVPGSGGAYILTLPTGAMSDIRGFKPDIVHTELLGIAGLFAWYAARRLAVPFVGTDHTFPADFLQYVHLNFPPFPYLVKKLSAVYYNRCAIVTTPSESLLHELRDYGMRRPGKVVPNPVHLDLFRPLQSRAALKEKYGIQNRAVLVFGRIAIEKNIEFAVRAFSLLPRNSNAQLVFIGDGPHRGAIEKLVEDMRLSDRTVFLGVLRGERLVEAINACDVSIIASLSETQSLTTIQSLACGLPVVAQEAGGIPEYVIEGKTGYLVEVGNVGMFAKRIQELLDSPSLSRALGTAGRESVLKFEPDAIAQKFEAIYDSARK